MNHIDILTRDGCPINSYIRAMRFYSDKNEFSNHSWVNKKLGEFQLSPSKDLVDGQKALLTMVINIVRANIDPGFVAIIPTYEQGETNMSELSRVVAELNTVREKAEAEKTKKPNENVKPAAKKESTVKTTKTRVVKVADAPKKNRKAEKFNILLTMLREAGEKKAYATREEIAAKIGATPGSVGVMISELRKDTALNIESTKQGYRILPSEKKEAA